ncbi:hypothetical protein Tco_0881397, partial [Tanacetum coccineum]
NQRRLITETAMFSGFPAKLQPMLMCALSADLMKSLQKLCVRRDDVKAIIFESKGELGAFMYKKRQLTVPQEKANFIACDRCTVSDLIDNNCPDKKPLEFDIASREAVYNPVEWRLGLDEVEE